MREPGRLERAWSGLSTPTRRLVVVAAAVLAMTIGGFAALKAAIVSRRDWTAHRLIIDEERRAAFVAREFPAGISRGELARKLQSLGIAAGFYDESSRTHYAKWIADPGMGRYLVQSESMILFEFVFTEDETLDHVIAEPAFTGP